MARYHCPLRRFRERGRQGGKAARLRDGPTQGDLADRGRVRPRFPKQGSATAAKPLGSPRPPWRVSRWPADRRMIRDGTVRLRVMTSRLSGCWHSRIAPRTRLRDSSVATKDSPAIPARRQQGERRCSRVCLGRCFAQFLPNLLPIRAMGDVAPDPLKL